MREDVYKRHIENVDNHWWFQARKNIINNSIRKNISKKNAKILDYGAGSGGNILMLSKFGKIFWCVSSFIINQTYFNYSIVSKNTLYIIQ